eukprot:4014542-Prorocentrum_lima.AAC.1
MPAAALWGVDDVRDPVRMEGLRAELLRTVNAPLDRMVGLDSEEAEAQVRGLYKAASLLRA